jgi:CRISPR-associated protein Csm2
MCEDYKFEIEYYDEEGYIKSDLFSNEAEKIVNCFLDPEIIVVDGDYEKNKKGEFKCYGVKTIKNNEKIYYGRNEYKKDCPKRNRKKIKKLSSTQIRKFYEEVLNLKAQYENGKSFKEILPYFKMLKAKANVAYERDVINTNFKTFIEKNVDYVGDEEEKFKVFCTFFEAVVAYAKGNIKD